MNRNPSDTRRSPASWRFIGGVGFALVGLSIAILIFLWLKPINTPNSPPLFIRLFGTFIAVVLLTGGGTGMLAAIAAAADHRKRAVELQKKDSNPQSRPPPS